MRKQQKAGVCTDSFITVMWSSLISTGDSLMKATLPSLNICPSCCSRERDHWYVSDTVGKKSGLVLKAKAGVQFQSSPPPDGWKFRVARTWKKDAGFNLKFNSKFNNEERPMVVCCSITVKLTGKAKETHPGCEGRYSAVKGMSCRGRQVFSF